MLEESEEILRCMKCGECQAACPTYRVSGRESKVARGRIRLVKAFIDGEVKASREFTDIIYSCSMCKACVVKCPSGVGVDRIIAETREKLVDEKGLSFKKRMVFYALRDPSLAYSVGRLIPKRMRFGLTLPSMPFKRAKSSEKKLVFFAGCLINYLYPKIGKAALSVLEHNKVEITMIDEQCCGAPLYLAGDFKGARSLAEQNLRLLYTLGAEGIITACPTCSLAFREYYPRLFEGDERVHALAENTWDVTEFLSRDNFGELNAKVTYHDACHLNFGLGVNKAPRELIKKIKGIEFEEMPHPEACCGFGGTFSIDNPDLAARINSMKLDYIQETEAEIVLTGCPGCKLNLERSMALRGMDKRVMHTIELMEASYNYKEDAV